MDSPAELAKDGGSSSLAQATAVEYSEMSASVPIAIEEEQPRQKKADSFPLKVGAVILLLIVAVVGGVCGSGHCSSSEEEEQEPTLAPTSYRAVQLTQAMQDSFDLEDPLLGRALN